MQIFIDGLEWIIVMLLSAVWSHSDGTHSLQRIHWWASDVVQIFSKSVLMNKNSSISWMAWGQVHFQKIVDLSLDSGNALLKG